MAAAPATARRFRLCRPPTEKFITVESALYRVELSNHGAVVRSWKLKKYFDDQNPPRPLDLVNPDVVAATWLAAFADAFRPAA